MQQDALSPLADAIADRVWAKSCQANLFGRWWYTVDEDDRNSFRVRSLRSKYYADESREKYPMLCMGMNFCKGNTSTQLQLDLAAWYKGEVRNRMSRYPNDVRRWSNIIAQADIDHSANLDTIIDCLIVCSPAYAKSGQIYFLRAGNLVKIGISQDTQRRASQIQTHCPFPLNCEVTVHGCQWHERYLHVTFSEQRESGEWFRENPTLNELIRLLKLIRDTPERKGRMAS